MTLRRNVPTSLWHGAIHSSFSSKIFCETSFKVIVMYVVGIHIDNVGIFIMYRLSK